MSLIEAAGAALPDHEVDGYNLTPWLTGKQDESPRKQYAYEQNGTLEALREGLWKLRLVDGEPQLFHLESDPAARWNRAEANPQRVEERRREMQRVAERISAEGPN